MDPPLPYDIEPGALRLRREDPIFWTRSGDGAENDAEGYQNARSRRSETRSPGIVRVGTL